MSRRGIRTPVHLLSFLFLTVECGISSCSDGESFNSTACNCDLTDICLADNPCVNGVCNLGSSPDQYTCNCTGTNYMGTNCSGIVPEL